MQHLPTRLRHRARHRDRRAEGISLSNLGRLDADHGSREEAAQYHGRALAIAREVGSQRDEGYVLANLGSLRADEGWLDEARV